MKLQSKGGAKVYAEAVSEHFEDYWQQFTANLTASATDYNAEISLQLAEPGSVVMDSWSLFPGKNFIYGRDPYPFRRELLNTLKSLKPRRAPGEVSRRNSCSFLCSVKEVTQSVLREQSVQSAVRAHSDPAHKALGPWHWSSYSLTLFTNHGGRQNFFQPGIFLHGGRARHSQCHNGHCGMK